jgi:enamine deaminase RidA (YjgF/YER057c/UK114 family)
VGEVAVSSTTLGDNVMVSLDWAKLIGPLPAPPPFCSAAVTADGTIYVSGSQAVALSPSGKPALVPGGPGPEVRHILTTIDAVIRACGGTGAQDITMVSVCRFPTTATPSGFPTLKFD